MSAPEGNQFWRARSRHGRKPKWDDPELLREACYEYIQWYEDHPLEEAVTYQGVVMDNPVPKMRAMTIGSLCIFLGITKETWTQYRQRDGFPDVTNEIDEIIRSQKFEGAAAGMLNPVIISRDLGLTDKQELSTDPKKPLKVIGINVTAEEAEQLYNDIID